MQREPSIYAGLRYEVGRFNDQPTQINRPPFE